MSYDLVRTGGVQGTGSCALDKRKGRNGIPLYRVTTLGS